MRTRNRDPWPEWWDAFCEPPARTPGYVVLTGIPQSRTSLLSLPQRERLSTPVAPRRKRIRYPERVA